MIKENEFYIDKKGTDCVYCGFKPKVIHYESNLWYVQCSNKACKKHSPYAYMGFHENVAKDRWEYANRPMNRTPSQKPKKK